MIQMNDEESLFYFFFFFFFGGRVSLNGGANLLSGIGLSVNLWNVANQAPLKRTLSKGERGLREIFSQ